MENKVKFEYILKCKNTWIIKKQVFTLEELEKISILDYIYELNINWNDFEIIAKRQYVWIKDINKNEVYNWDIIRFFGFWFDIIWYIKFWEYKTDNLEDSFYDTWNTWFYIECYNNYSNLNYTNQINTKEWKIEIIWNIYEDKNILESNNK